MPVGPVLSFGLRAAGSSAALHFWGGVEPPGLAAYKSQRALSGFMQIPAAGAGEKRMCCPAAWIGNCLMEERNKRMSYICKNVSWMLKPHSMEQLGCRNKGFRCFLTFGGSFQTTGELFSSFLSAPVRWHLQAG